MNRAVILALLSACAPSADRVLPDAPPGATAVAIVTPTSISTAEDPILGWLSAWPLNDDIVLAGTEIEAHFYGDLRIGDDPLPRRTALFAAADCDDHGLPAPIASFAMNEGGTVATPARALRAPALHCVSTPTSAFALTPPKSPTSCRRSEVRIEDCELVLDRTDCEASSVWPVQLDGTVCGPRGDDPVCAPAPLPSGALVAAQCAPDGIYTLYPRRELGLEVERIAIVAKARALGFDTLYLNDFVVFDDRISAITGANKACVRGTQRTLVLYDRALGTLTATPAPGCLFGMVAAPDGGFWATSITDITATELTLWKMDARGVGTASVTIAMPDPLLRPGYDERTVFTMIDTTTSSTSPELTIVVNGANTINDAARTSLVRIDARTLQPLATLDLDASVRGVDVDPAARELVITDHTGDRVLFVPYPVGAPVDDDDVLQDPLGGIEMGPVLRIGTRHLVGQTGMYPGYAVFDGRPSLQPSFQSLFALTPIASAQAFHRLGGNLVFGVFAVRETEATLVQPAALWATIFDFESPEHPVPGVASQRIGDERVSRTRLVGRDVWVALPNAGTLVRVRVP